MKNLMIFLNLSKRFYESDVPWKTENESLIKIQIENSLALGWKPRDIHLVTNFKYEYLGVKAMVVPDKLFFAPKPTATKIFVILHLINKGVIGSDLWWFHDLDAFQLEPISTRELNLKSPVFALTDYGKSSINDRRSLRWSTGSIFFDKAAQPLFDLIRDKVVQYNMNEEVMLLMLTRINKHHINSVIKKLNITYNLATRKRDIKACWEMADKPLKVVHFHPFDTRPLDFENGNNNIEALVLGKNRVGKPYVNQRIKELFIKYGII